MRKSLYTRINRRVLPPCPDHHLFLTHFPLYATNNTPSASHRLPIHRKMSTITYPEMPRLNLVEKLHGVDVPDPYRWLEDPQSRETKVHPKPPHRLTPDFRITTEYPV